MGARENYMELRDTRVSEQLVRLWVKKSLKPLISSTKDFSRDRWLFSAKSEWNWPQTFDFFRVFAQIAAYRAI